MILLLETERAFCFFSLKGVSYMAGIDFKTFKKSGQFSKDQLKQIKDAFKSLDVDQITVFATPRFSAVQMYMMMQGFKNGLRKDQVEVCANPDFDEDQLEQILEGFYDGLTIDEVETYAKPENNRFVMQKERLQIKKNR